MSESRNHIQHRFFHWLILAYPPSFRQQFGDQIESAFSDMVTDSSRRHGWLGAASTSINAAFDLIKSIVPAYVQDFKEDVMQHKIEASIGGVLVSPAVLLIVTATALRLAGTSLYDQMKDTWLYHSDWPIVAFVWLPVLAVLINIVPTIVDAYKLNGNPLRYSFMRSHAFGLTVMVIGAGFIFFLLEHDNVGCAIQGLQHPTNYIEIVRACRKIHG